MRSSENWMLKQFQRCNTVLKVKDISICQQSSWISVIHRSHIKSGTKYQGLKITFDCSMNTGLYEYMINYNYELKQKSVSHLSSKCIAIAHHTKGRQFWQSSRKWKHTKFCFDKFCLIIVNYGQNIFQWKISSIYNLK
ncbi:Hypothetical_protein [Hexamita inflata]|uniref:Hypothetical_protein n=1 Tax=Hexamita inflata TaxID=28002 RepID=A0AA86TXL7_9EUKA|nr:Hypothetical protein HINF_LOCUS12393 [Hexamita inflata]